MLKFLVSAGADAESTVHRYVTLLYRVGVQFDQCSSGFKKLVFQLSLASLIENPTADFTNAVRTSSLAIDVCQSILGIDIADVIEDVLTEPQYASARVLLQQPSSDTPPHAPYQEVALVFNELEEDALLDYTIWHLPESFTLELLQRGDLPMSAAPLAYAARRNGVRLIEALLDAGGDVNACDAMGWTALHYTAYLCQVTFLKALVKLVEHEIDWHVRTPEGHSSLQLAKMSCYLSWKPPSKREEFFAIFRKHIADELDLSEESPLRIPGAFPTCAPPPCG